MQTDCPICGEKFEDPKKLNKHIQTKHKDKIKLIKLEHPQRDKR
ncbi:hypothetical protein KEJ34_00015 [Candidatus Bathyarchaeota archaeon]|nr:hypothetical protein [Candidatus Bathyarchaeota archaeon]